MSDENIKILKIAIALFFLFTVGGGILVFIGSIDFSEDDPSAFNQFKTLASMKEITIALDDWAVKNGKYPTSSEGLKTIKSSFPNAEVPKDAWGQAFVYLSPHGWNDCADDYVLISYGEDKKEGNDDYVSCYLKSEATQ